MCFCAVKNIMYSQTCTALCAVTKIKYSQKLMRTIIERANKQLFKDGLKQEYDSEYISVFNTLHMSKHIKVLVR